MKKLIVLLLSLLILSGLSACASTPTDGTVKNSLNGMHVAETYCGGRLASVQIYDLSSSKTTIYTYNYVYDKTLFCESVNVLILDEDGNVISQYNSDMESTYGGK